MKNLLASVDEKVIFNNFFQLETDGRKDIEFLLWLVCE